MDCLCLTSDGYCEFAVRQKYAQGALTDLFALQSQSVNGISQWEDVNPCVYGLPLDSYQSIVVSYRQTN